MTALETKRRSDFEANRELILAAADQTFKELGLETPIQQVALRAGVGIATVYRHFPTRDELIAAAFELRVDEHTQAILDAQKESSDVKAFRKTVHAITKLNASDLAFNAFVAGIDGTPTKYPAFLKFSTAFLDALTRAEKGNVWREDVAYNDVLLMLVGLDQVAPQLLVESEDALGRYTDLVLDGICRRRAPTEGKPLDASKVLAVFKN